MLNRESLVTAGSTADGASHLCNTCLVTGCFSDDLFFYIVMCIGIDFGFAAFYYIGVTADGADHFGITFCTAGGSYYVFFVVMTKCFYFITDFSFTASTAGVSSVTSIFAGGFGYNTFIPIMTETSAVTGIFSVGITADRAGVLNCFTSQTAGFDYFPCVVVTVGFAYRSKFGCISADRANFANHFGFGTGCFFNVINHIVFAGCCDFFFVGIAAFAGVDGLACFTAGRFYYFFCIVVFIRNL